VELYLADVGGFATHVRSCDDLKPGLPSLHAAVVLDEVHALLSLHTGMPAQKHDVHFVMQARKRSGKTEEGKQAGIGEGRRRKNKKAKEEQNRASVSLAGQMVIVGPNHPSNLMYECMNV
jgi:hypothetical protein